MQILVFDNFPGMPGGIIKFFIYLHSTNVIHVLLIFKCSYQITTDDSLDKQCKVFCSCHNSNTQSKTCFLFLWYKMTVKNLVTAEKCDNFKHFTISTEATNFSFMIFAPNWKAKTIQETLFILKIYSSSHDFANAKLFLSDASVAMAMQRFPWQSH